MFPAQSDILIAAATPLLSFSTLSCPAARSTLWSLTSTGWCVVRFLLATATFEFCAAWGLLALIFGLIGSFLLSLLTGCLFGWLAHSLSDANSCIMRRVRGRRAEDGGHPNAAGSDGYDNRQMSPSQLLARASHFRPSDKNSLWITCGSALTVSVDDLQGEQVLVLAQDSFCPIAGRSFAVRSSVTAPQLNGIVERTDQLAEI